MPTKEQQLIQEQIEAVEQQLLHQPDVISSQEEIIEEIIEYIEVSRTPSDSEYSESERSFYIPENTQQQQPLNNQINSQVQSQGEITITPQNLTQQLINSTSDNNQTTSEINQKINTQTPQDSQNTPINTQLSQKYANNPSYLNNAYNNNQFQNNGNQYFDNYNSMVNMDQPQSVPSATSGIREPVGFATLPNQIHQKAVRRGFEFTLMVCGESGLGKSTLLNSLFLTDVYSDQYPGPSRRHAKTLSVQETDVQISEGGVNLTLTIVDTPGYGDSINNTSAWNQVNDFIEQKFEKFLNGESRVTRLAKPTDKRVHCCLYFIAPTGHGMKALDIEFMKRLHDKVNIIPVISKADAMTPEEIKSFKAIINQQIAENLIHVYNFPDLDGELDGRKLRSKLPFAVIGSNYVMEGPGGKRVRARQYPWGFAEIENTEHCDFSTLRKMLLQSHMQDLVDTTANQHYEMYRQRKLSPVVTNMDHMSSGQESQSGEYDPNVEKNPIEQIEDEKRNHKTRMAQMEKEMEQVFQLKVQEKRKRLKDSEIELQRRHEQMKKKMEEEWDSLESRRQQFDNQRRQWEEQNKSHIQKMESKLKKEQGKNRGIF